MDWQLYTKIFALKICSLISMELFKYYKCPEEAKIFLVKILDVAICEKFPPQKNPAIQYYIQYKYLVNLDNY